MTPLEAAARAAYESTGLFKWEEVRDKGRVIAAMRAALLALAETDIFMAHSEAGAAELNADPTFNVQINADSAFKAILRSIASEGKEQ